mmetsp:Transcript_104592/g.234830  ORF Transcript_104592/g.234830 Transcript_104592/m.234830 type:complete len:362 (-) Transcript_104592:219-1304(-)
MTPACRPSRILLLAAVLASATVPLAEGQAAAGVSALPAGSNLRRQAQQLAEKEDTTPEPTASPEEDDTTPAPPPPPADENVESIMQEILNFMYSEIYNASRPWIIAAVAAVIGLILVISGQTAYVWLIILTVGAVAMIMSMDFVGSLWALKRMHPLVLLVGAEVATVTMLATYRGIDGVNIVVGVVFGLIVACRLQMFLVLLGCEFFRTDGGNSLGIVLLYSFVVLILMLVFRKEGHLRVLAFLSPIIGSLLVSSAIAFGVTLLVTKYPKVLGGSLDVKPVMGPWVEFLNQLILIRAPDRGVFAGSEYNLGGHFTTDRLSGWFLGLLFTLLGWKLQKPFRRSSRTVSARELHHALLETHTE